MGTPTQVCVWSCPNFSAPAGRPFRIYVRGVPLLCAFVCSRFGALVMSVIEMGGLNIFIMVGPSNSENLISRLDLGNPFHLQNSDFNANTIISVKLTGTENYRVWAAAMKLVINTRNKTRFIDGSCIKSAYANSPALSNQWERCNSIVLSWLLNSVSKDLFLGSKFSADMMHHEIWA
ncbi:ribonuclease H-like domain-containing protein [Tanacetum coccineum]